MESTTKSLASPDGSSLQRLVQDVAPHSTAIDNESSVSVVLALTLGLLKEMMSPDQMMFAVSHAQRMATECGIEEEEFKRVMAALEKYWRESRARNPLSGLF